MRRILTIALFFIAGQVAAQKYAMSPGEYTQGFIDSANKIGYTLTTDNTIAGTGNFGGQGIAYPVVTGYSNKQMKLVCTGLHDGGFVSLDSGHAFMYGLASNCQLGNGLTTGPSTCYEILTDALGNPFYNINGMTAGWGPVDAVPFYAATKTGGGDTVWVWGNGTPLGMGSCLKPTATIVATGKTVTQIVANNSFIHAVCSDGTVYVIGGQDDYAANSGTNSNPTTWTQVTGLPSIAYVVKGNSFVFAVPTTGTDLWGWGEYGWIVENQSTVSYMPITSPTKVTSYFPSGIFPIAQMVAAHTGYAILNTTTNSLFTGGSNEVGLCGTGPTIIWPLYTTGGSTPYNGGTAAPWNWNTGMGQYLNQCIQICKGANVKWGYIYGGPLYSFYFYFEATNGSLVTEGRAKDVLGDGVIFADSAGTRIAAAFAMGHNITYPSLLPDLLSVTTATVASCPGCVDGESPISGTTPCTYGTDGPSRPNTNLRCNLVVTPTPGGYNWSIATSTTDGSHKIMWDHSVLISTGGTPVNTGIPGGESGSVTGVAAGTYTITDTLVDNSWDTVEGSTSFTVPAATQTGFYVSTSVPGSDANPGTSTQPFLTFAHAWSVAGPGDTIYLKGGDLFTIPWSLPGGGTSASPIVVTNYGTGRYTLSGLYTLTGGTSMGNNIYEFYVPGMTSSLNMLLLNSVPERAGSYPDTGVLHYTSISGTTLNYGTTTFPYNYSGATVCTYSDFYIRDTANASAITSTSLTLSVAPSGSGSRANGYFFENHPNTLLTTSRVGAWYKKVSVDSIQVYLPGGLGSNVLQVPVQDNLLSFSSDSNIQVNNGEFDGSNLYTVNINNGTGIKFTNCWFHYGATNGFQANNCYGLGGTGDTLTCFQNNGGYITGSSSTHHNFTNLFLDSIGIWVGMGQGGGSGTSSYTGWSDGFGYDTYTNFTAKNIGYVGLYLAGDSNRVYSPYIDTFCVVKQDGGGFYTWSGSFPTIVYGDSITNGLILHGQLNMQGLTYNGADASMGWYGDGHSKGWVFTNCTGSYNASGGFFIHGSNMTLNYPTAYGNLYGQIVIEEALGISITGLSISHATMGLSASGQYTLVFTTPANDLGSFCSSCDFNTFVLPFGTTSHIYTQSSVDVGTNRTLSSWQGNQPYDVHSTSQAGRLVYVYNTGSSTSALPLWTECMDLSGGLHPGSISIAGYGSQILLIWHPGFFTKQKGRNIFLN